MIYKEWSYWLYASLKCQDYNRDRRLFWILLFSTGFSLILQIFFFGRLTLSNLYTAIFHVIDLCHKITIKLGSPPKFWVIQPIGWTPHARSVWIYMRVDIYILLFDLTQWVVNFQNNTALQILKGKKR